MHVPGAVASESIDSTSPDGASGSKEPAKPNAKPSLCSSPHAATHVQIYGALSPGPLGTATGSSSNHTASLGPTGLPRWARVWLVGATVVALVALVLAAAATVSKSSSSPSTTTVGTTDPAAALTMFSSFVNVKRDCSYFRTNPPIAGAANLVDGLYSLPVGGNQLYCDFSTGGGSLSWTLLSTFEQPGGQWMSAFPAAAYSMYFATAGSMWIQGGSTDGRPSSPDPLVDAAFHVRSLDWNSVLIAGRSYMLRQRFFRGSWPGGIANRTLMFDVGYRFTFNGFVLQDQTLEPNNRAWTLTNRTVYADSTGIVWDTPVETVRFWLPFSSTVTAAPGLYAGCDGFDFSLNGCGLMTIAARGFGTAGIIGSISDYRDVAAGWGPMVANANYDIVLVQQSPPIYGTSAGSLPSTQSIFLAYYIAPL